MKSNIKVYLFPDTSKYIVDEKERIINEIEKDTQTVIRYVSKKYDSFFTIQGKFEQVHQARIILQDIEKNIYREVHVKSTFNNKED